MRLPLAAVLLCAAGTADATLYTCVDAQGNKTVSDKACGAQTTQKVYTTPPKAPPETTPAPSYDPQSLTPQSADEVRAMLKVRERAAQGLPPEGDAPAAPPGPKETDAQRHMRKYLEQKTRDAPPTLSREEREQQAREEADEDDERREQEARRVKLCVELRRQYTDRLDAERRPHGPAYSETSRTQRANLLERMSENDCGK